MPESPLSYQLVQVGDEAPVLTHTLTRADLAQYAGASGDFNPMHVDEQAAKQAGLKGVFGHGMWSAGVMATAITNWVGIGNMRRYNVRFLKPTWPGEELSTRVRITGKRSDGDVYLIELDCSLANGAGEVKVAGEAEVELPA